MVLIPFGRFARTFEIGFVVFLSFVVVVIIFNWQLEQFSSGDQ